MEKCKEKLLALARQEIDYYEKASNSSLDDPAANKGSGNYTKYARDLDKLGWFYNGPKQGYAYCDVFHDWLHVMAWGAEKALEVLCQPKYSAGAGCAASANYYKTAGRFYSYPEVGDQVFYYVNGAIGHTGAVEAIENGYVITIEGNVSNKVMRCRHLLTDGSIAGYGRPRYDIAAGITASSGVASEGSSNRDPDELSYGMKSDAVKKLQENLISLGFSCGPDGADGEFGINTFTAVKKYQTSKNLSPDGVVGPKTRAAIAEDTKDNPDKIQNGNGDSKADSKFEKGDIVNFTGNKHYTMSQGGKEYSCKPGLAKITNVVENAKHPYHLVRVSGKGSTVFGWVDKDTVEEA